MSQRFNIIAPRKKNDGGTFWVRIGSAFSRQDGGFQLVFDALPLTDADGRCTVLVAPQQDQQGAPRQQQRQAPPQQTTDDDFGGIPF